MGKTFISPTLGVSYVIITSIGFGISIMALSDFQRCDVRRVARPKRLLISNL